MPKLVFRNKNTKAIKEILKMIGKEGYIEALEREDITEQPPLNMRGFYLEYDTVTRETNIWYQYDGGVLVNLLSAEGYWEVPVKGWEIAWITK